MIAVLKRLDRALARIERAAVVLLLTTLLGLGLLQVLLRNLLAGGLFWVDGLLRHLVLWLGFLGASLATHDRRHLRIDVLVPLLPPWGQRSVSLLVNLSALCVCLLLAHAAWVFVYSEYAAGTVLTFGVAAWLAQSIIPVGFLIMALRFALRFLEALRQLGERLR